jgi:hypothetical protein
MKHQNIRSKADRAELKRKHERRQPPHRRQDGISIRKTIKAFVYDVFEDGYPHRSASGGTKTWATDQT